MNTKLQNFAKLIQAQKIEEYRNSLGFEETYTWLRTGASVIPGNKYIKIDIGEAEKRTGFLMIDKEGNIFGIKSYGKINKRRCYGTLDTISDYYWGKHSPLKKEQVK